MKRDQLFYPQASSGKHYLDIDVADGVTDRFICSLRMPVNPLFRITGQEIADFVYSKRPTLRYRRIIVEFPYPTNLKIKDI